jgi:CRISPR-associated endonuclease/helicase Cas3
MEPYERRGILRKLQRYTVNIREYECRKLLENRDIREIFPGVYIQDSDLLYHSQLGLLMSKDIVFDPTQGVI